MRRRQFGLFRSVYPIATGLCLAGLLCSSGCKSGQSWAPKMPKMGMPELAFGNKKSAIDDIEPPAAHFTPEGNASALAQNEDRRSPYQQEEPGKSNNSPSRTLERQPYAVDDEPTGLADYARSQSEKLLTQSQPTQRLQEQYNSVRDDYQQTQERFSRSVANSNLLPSSQNQNQNEIISSIPGGPLPGIGGSSSLAGIRNSSPALPPPPSTSTPGADLYANNQAGASSGLGSNTGSRIPSMEDNSFNGRTSANVPDSSSAFPPLNSPSMPGLSSPPAWNNSSGLSAPAAPTNPPAAAPMTFPPLNASTNTLQPSTNTAAIPSQNPLAAPTNSLPNSLPNSMANSMASPSTGPVASPTPAYAVPNTSGGFRPGSTMSTGSTMNSSAMPSFGQPASSGPANAPTLPASPSTGFPPAQPTTQPALPSGMPPAYPSTGAGSFQNPGYPNSSFPNTGAQNPPQNTYPVQPVGYQTSTAAIQPNGAVCENGVCTLPQQPPR